MSGTRKCRGRANHGIARRPWLQIMPAFVLMAAMCICGSGAFATGSSSKRPDTNRRRPSPWIFGDHRSRAGDGQSAPVRLIIQPYLLMEGCGGLITDGQALAYVAPPTDGVTKTLVTMLTLTHNECLYVSAWRCGGPGSGSQAPMDGAKVLYKIELFASGAKSPFYTYSRASLPSLTHMPLTAVTPSQTLGTITVRVTREATDASWLQGDWLSIQFVRL